MKRFVGVFALAFLIMFSSVSYAGEWKQDNIGWWYQNDDGNYIADDWLKEENGDWYHFDTNGYMQTGFTEVYRVNERTGELGHDCYYFDDESGKMRTGWILVEDTYDCFFNDNIDDRSYGKWIKSR